MEIIHHIIYSRHEMYSRMLLYLIDSNQGTLNGSTPILESVGFFFFFTFSELVGSPFFVQLDFIKLSFESVFLYHI